MNSSHFNGNPSDHREYHAFKTTELYNNFELKNSSDQTSLFITSHSYSYVRKTFSYEAVPTKINDIFYNKTPVGEINCTKDLLGNSKIQTPINLTNIQNLLCTNNMEMSTYEIYSNNDRNVCTEKLNQGSFSVFCVCVLFVYIIVMDDYLFCVRIQTIPFDNG